MTASTARAAGMVLAGALLAATAAPAHAQAAGDGTGLLLGPLTLRPSIVLRDAGTDSNIFNEPGDGREDRTARLTGATDAELRVGLVQLSGTGAAEYLYFERYTAERAVNGWAGLRIQPQLSRVRPFVTGAYRRTRERASSEIDVRAPRTEHEYGAGIEARLLTRAVLQASVRRAFWRFDEGEQFRDVPLATRLNRRSEVVDVTFRYELSPLTSVTAGTSLVRDRFTLSPDRDTDAWSSEVGFLFAPDAVIRGRAVVGVRDMRPRGSTPVPFRGPTASVDLSYTLLNRTVLTGRVVRETTVSVETEPYYLSTLAALDVSHNLIGPVDLLGRFGRERLDYDTLAAFARPGHRDHVRRYGGGVAVRLGPHMRAAVEYEDIRRRSDGPADREYDRRRLYTTINYGF